MAFFSSNFIGLFSEADEFSGFNREAALCWVLDLLPYFRGFSVHTPPLLSYRFVSGKTDSLWLEKFGSIPGMSATVQANKSTFLFKNIFYRVVLSQRDGLCPPFPALVANLWNRAWWRYDTFLLPI
ncbi:hypothetical protein PIB30_030555 [Stylosanthes scabra]|uniref:Uncharacterized protein n=1 Tax=Stylosanthes scabra TaxID=79078 RepID=A0ABU6SBH6_9FABA|nr:hypothetical protein [Stylosanthes scabra]